MAVKRKALVKTHFDLEVYQTAYELTQKIFLLTRKFPKEEIYSLTSQIRRSSRSICGNIAEAWRKRRYEGAFISKLSDAEAEAAETQTWIHIAVGCEYLPRTTAADLYKAYDSVLGMVVSMINNAEQWKLK